MVPPRGSLFPCPFDIHLARAPVKGSFVCPSRKRAKEEDLLRTEHALSPVLSSSPIFSWDVPVSECLFTNSMKSPLLKFVYKMLPQKLGRVTQCPMKDTAILSIWGPRRHSIVRRTLDGYRKGQTGTAPAGLARSIQSDLQDRSDYFQQFFLVSISRKVVGIQPGNS